MKKLNKTEKALKRSEKIYERVKEELNLNGSVNEQISQLIDECCNIQSEICLKSDEIKLDNYEKALELIKIDKGTWIEFVNIAAKKYYGKLKEKQIDKYANNCQLKRHIANLKQSFYDSYLSDEPLKVLDENDKQTYDFDNERNDEFQNLMENSAKIRDYINNSLYIRYKTLYQCAFYLTNGEIKYNEFKDMVDWQYYANSTNHKYPDKAWKLFEKFNRMIRLFDKYSNSKSDEHIKELKKEFGFKNIELGTEQPKKHPWDNDEDEE